MKIKQRHFIRKSELKPLKEEILKQYDQKFIDQIFPKKSNVEVIQTESGDTLYAVNNELKIWKSNSIIKLMRALDGIENKCILEEGLNIILNLCNFSERGYLHDPYKSESYSSNDIVESDKVNMNSILKAEFI